MGDYRVALQYEDDLGYVSYDEQEKSFTIHLANAEGKQKAEDFLSRPHEMQLPIEGLHDFQKVTVDAKEGLSAFQLVLTRMWWDTGVHVDWSRPVDYVIAHPKYE